MSFTAAQTEIRDRFAETRLLLDNLRRIAPPPLTPVDNTQKALRGLWLVSLYAAVERSVNAAVEAAITDISSQGLRSIDSTFNLHGIFHFNKVQSLNACGKSSIFEKSAALFEASLSDQLLTAVDNPLAKSLQNVDAKTMKWVLNIFGASDMNPSASSIGRTNTLRERRNAVAHGRESATEVGERYSIGELENLFNAADEVVASFMLALEDHCSSKGYIRETA